MGPSNFLQELMLANSEYEEVWKGMDEAKNSSQKHIESIVKAQKIAEVEQELRKVGKPIIFYVFGNNTPE